MQSTTNGGMALDRAFSFLWLVIKRKKEKVCIFQDRKMSRGGVLIFVVADIWNCYNMDMFKLRYKQEYSADLSKTSLQLPVDIFPYLNGGYATDNIAKITP